MTYGLLGKGFLTNCVVRKGFLINCVVRKGFLKNCVGCKGFVKNCVGGKGFVKNCIGGEGFATDGVVSKGFVHNFVLCVLAGLVDVFLAGFVILSAILFASELIRASLAGAEVVPCLLGPWSSCCSKILFDVWIGSVTVPDYGSGRIIILSVLV